MAQKIDTYLTDQFTDNSIRYNSAGIRDLATSQWRATIGFKDGVASVFVYFNGTLTDVDASKPVPLVTANTKVQVINSAGSVLGSSSFSSWTKVSTGIYTINLSGLAWTVDRYGLECIFQASFTNPSVSGKTSIITDTAANYPAETITVNWTPVAIAVAYNDLGDFNNGIDSIPDSKLAEVYIKADGTRAMTGVLDLGNNKIVNLSDPTQSTDAATKSYVDAVKQGLDVKDSVRAASIANMTLTGEQSVDGVALVAGDRILVKNQTTASENGIYSVSATAWSRTADADENAEVTSGLFTFIEEGNTNANSGWMLTTNDPITVGTTALTFVQFSGAGQIEAGAGLSKTGNRLDVNVDDATIEILSDVLRVKDGGITIPKLSFDPATQAELDAHTTNTSNPHSVTPSQIGAVENEGGFPAVRSDLLANRPAAGTSGRYFFATDELKIYFDDGAQWNELYEEVSTFNHIMYALTGTY